MHVVCLSDTHTLKPEVPDGDMLIHCGDFSGLGNIKELVDFDNWLSSFPHKYKIFISGNHDGIFEQNYSFSKSLVNPSIIYLQDELIEIEGLRIYGSPWTPTFNDWHFMKDRGSPIQEVWDKIPNNLDVLITHGPPCGILDYSIYSHESVGCSNLLQTVMNSKPKFHIFGHLHGNYGIFKDLNTTFINCAVLNDNYKLVNKCVEFDI
jgi:Icc-related predicted phosphoesterase